MDDLMLCVSQQTSSEKQVGDFTSFVGIILVIPGSVMLEDIRSGMSYIDSGEWMDEKLLRNISRRGIKIDGLQITDYSTVQCRYTAEYYT